MIGDYQSPDPDIELVEVISSKVDRTQKLIFKNIDNQILEISYIDKGDGKNILCVPTQNGCSQGCLFCHLTGSKIEVSDLLDLDMIDAVQFAQKYLELDPEKPLLVSFMGSGEPLLNWNDVARTMETLSRANKKIRFALATILPQGSEVELVKLGQFVREKEIDLKIHLSLHYTLDDQRQKWMPGAGLILSSLDLLQWYRDFTGNRIEIHYTPIAGVNDLDVDVCRLEYLLRSRDIPVKLLEFNPRAELQARPSEDGRFYYLLRNARVKCEHYTPPGRDIGASCGQFDLKYYKEKK